MQEDIIIQISNRIKERRKEKGITIQELANRTQVSKSLISQVENSRIIPSLIVLIEIIKALDIDLNAFFQDITIAKNPAPILVKRRDEYQPFEKEQAVGFNYNRIFTQSVKNSTVDIVLLELEVNASRPMIRTQAFEYKYFISGQVNFKFEDQSIVLNPGDSMLFDGRRLHTPQNVGTVKASMLAIYFFEGEK